MNDIWRDLLHLRADVTLIIGLLLAIGVTVHVLLRKREVQSAVGWIGLVWFAPILGAIAYAMLGINRVQRRAMRLLGQDSQTQDRSKPEPTGTGSELDALSRGIGRITRYELHPGTRIESFQNGDAAYPAMLKAIGAAERTIGLSSYIFRDDRWGGHFIDALTDAKARGVAVRVLIDGWGGGWLLSRAYHRLHRQGVPAARFMHSLLPWRMPFINLRSHKKILVIDGRIGFTGGMNLADENVMATQPKAPVRDVHFRVEGPVVSQLADTFAQDWNSATNEDLDPATWLPQQPDQPGPFARVIDSGPDDDLEKIEFAILQAVACAQKSIAVMTPYFLPDERMITALSLAAMRGVAVDIVVPEVSDHLLMSWALPANIGPLLSDGVRVWRSPPPFHHTKLMVVDGEWCLIGSCNWDVRSFRLNFELCLELYDTALAAYLTDLMHQTRGSALSQADLDSRRLPTRLRDAAARLLLPYL